MPKLGSVRTHDRFNRITWGLLNSPAEVDYQLQEVFPYGLIAGGLVDGTVQVWDARAIIDPCVHELPRSSCFPGTKFPKIPNPTTKVEHIASGQMQSHLG